MPTKKASSGTSLADKIKNAVTGKKEDEAQAEETQAAAPEASSDGDAGDETPAPGEKAAELAEEPVKTRDPMPTSPEPERFAYKGKKKFTVVQGIKLGGKLRAVGESVDLDAGEANAYGLAVRIVIE